MKEQNKSIRGRSYFLACVLLLLAAAGSMLLPSFLLDWQDEKRVGRREVKEVPGVVLTAQEDMQILEKIRLIGLSSVNGMPMVNGKHYDQESIEEKSREELQKLQQLGFWEGIELEKLQIVEKEVTFLMDQEDSEKSMLLWSCSGVVNDWGVNWTMDDETGKILQFFLQQNYYDAKSTVAESAAAVESIDGSSANGAAFGTEDLTGILGELMEMPEKWAEYLECEAVEKGYEAIHAQYDDRNERYNLFDQGVRQLLKEGLSLGEAYMVTMEMFGQESKGIIGGKVYVVLQGEDQTEVLYYFCKRGNSFYNLTSGSF